MEKRYDIEFNVILEQDDWINYDGIEAETPEKAIEIARAQLKKQYNIIRIDEEIATEDETATIIKDEDND